MDHRPRTRYLKTWLLWRWAILWQKLVTVNRPHFFDFFRSAPIAQCGHPRSGRGHVFRTSRETPTEKLGDVVWVYHTILEKLKRQPITNQLWNRSFMVPSPSMVTIFAWNLTNLCKESSILSEQFFLLKMIMSISRSFTINEPKSWISAIIMHHVRFASYQLSVRRKNSFSTSLETISHYPKISIFACQKSDYREFDI